MAKKLDSSLKNMLIVLTLIGLVSAFALGFTYEKTKPAIAAIQIKKQQAAIKAVLPDFDKLGDKYSVDGFENVELFPASKDGKLVGTAVKTYSNNGFNGNIQIMVGLTEDGTVYNTSVIYQGETPGLGTNMTTPKFKDQFNGKNKSGFKFTVKKDGGDVDAITAATISSRAFCDAMNRAIDAYSKREK